MKTINLKYILMLLFATILFLSCTNKKEEKTAVENETLLVSTYGKVLNVNLTEKKIQWQYQSKYNLDGNRNLFSLSTDMLIQPFESGELIAFNINSGKIVWQQHILGGGGGVEDAVGGPDGGFDTTFVNNLKPLFMTQPLITGDNVYITSTCQPNSTNKPALYNFNKKTGEQIWAQELPTVFNLFSPVLHHKNIFVNSAVFLNMYTPEGTDTSYGAFDGADDHPNAEKNQFEKPIYAQMQSDDKLLFIGDEKGRFYALKFDNNALPNSDIMDPNNTFTKNPKLFEWKFDDKNISNLHFDGRTYLHDDYLISAVNQSDNVEAIIALEKSSGKSKWTTPVKGLKTWNLVGDKITATNGEQIYLLDTEGKIMIKTDIQNEFAPVSNIEIDSKGNLIYATTEGITKYDIKGKKFLMLFKQPFKSGDHNSFQIKYLNK